MSALDSIKQNLGVSTTPPLTKDIQSKGTTQPDTQPKPATSAVDAIRSNLTTSPTAPLSTPTKPKEEEKGLYGKYADGVRKGIVAFDAGFVSSVGQLVRSFQWASDRVVGTLIGERIDTEKSFAISAQEKTKQWADILKKSEGITPENQSFVNKVFEGAGSSATYFIPAVGVFKGASVLGKVSPSIASLFGSSASAGLEAMAEAGQVFDEVKKKDGLDKATVASTKTFWANAILLTVTERLGVFNPSVKGMLKKALLSAPTEAFQESVQQIIQNNQTGRPTWEGVLESGAIGGIIGSVMGGTVDAVSGGDVATPVQINDGKVGVPTNVEGEKPSAYTALKQNLKPAIEIQKAIEGEKTAPLSPTASPTSKTAQTEAKEGQPIGEGSAPSPRVDIKIPSYAQAEKLIAKEGGFANASSLPATNRADAEQLGTSLSLNPKFLYTQATKQGIKLRDFLLRLDSETDIAKRTAIGSELMETLSQKPVEAVSPIEEEAQKYNTVEDFIKAYPESEEGLSERIQVAQNAIEVQKKTRKPEAIQDQIIYKDNGRLTVVDRDAYEGTKDYTGAILPKPEKIRGEVVAVVKKDGSIVKASMKQKTQTEKVKESVKEGAKSIKQVAEETGIKEPNIRRILGVGEKEGTFTRVEKGVYVLNNGKEDIAFIHTGDAVETLPKLAKEGFKADMVFLDIPYDTPAVKGGNRGVEYNLLSVSDFKKVMTAVSDIVKDENTPVYYMYSQAESGLKAMMKYNDVLTDTGFKAIAKGDFQKLFQTGKPVTNVRGVVAKPEGIILLNKSGVFNEKDAQRNLDFSLRRPKGYQTEKPAELLKSLILQGTKEGDTVLDPFAGSGVTGAESVKAGRKAVLIEKNKEVVEKVTKPRVEEASKESKQIGLMDFDESYTPRMNKLIKEAQEKGETFPFSKMTAEEQAILDKAWKDKLNKIPMTVPEGFKPYEATVTTKTIDVKRLSEPAYFKEVYESTFAVGGDKGLYKILTKELVPKDREASSFLADKYNEAKKTIVEQPTSGSRGASIGRYRDGTELSAPEPDSLKPIAFPELLDLSKELTGNVPFIKKYTKSNGMFYGKNGGEIGLNPSLFEKGNERQLAGTMAHEIGHLVDYLPDETLNRGNLMGRLNTLKDFRKDFFAPAGASRSNPELKEQMWELSKYWRPLDEATATPSFLKYRKSSEEIYADFISALFNEPRTVSQIAPTAYNVFFQQLDAKPAVKQAYFELQDLLRNGDLVAKRRSATQSMFKLTEQESKERQIQNEIEEKNKEKSIWFKFKTQAVDITESVREKVKEAQKAGKEINPDDNPTYYLEERNYLGGKIKAEVDEKFNTIYQELQKDGMSWEDLGELMFYERILKGDRQEIANPLGYQPDFVQELYDVYEDVGSVKPDQEAHKKGTSDMKQTLGEAKFQKLQKLAEEYRANLKGFFEQGRAEGIYNEELAKMFEDNAFYVPFKGAKYSGVTKTTFGVKAQKGTLGNIENPANTGIEKAVSIIRAIERNKVTRKTMEFMSENFAGEVQEAKTDKNGYPIDPKENDLGLVTYMKDGKVKGFYVDKYIADAIKKNTVADQNLLIGSLRFWNSRLFRPLFITFNLGFQSFNAIRDFKRFWKNVPNMTVLKAIGLYSKSLRGAKIRAFGLPKNPSQADIEAYNMINDLEKSQTLSITYNDIIKGEAIEDAQIDRILREVGVREAESTKLGELGAKYGIDKNSPIIKQAFQIMDFIEKTGNLVESIPKIAGVYALEGKMQPREMRSFVRKYVGSPDFMAGGKFKPYMNEVFLFSNAIFQGVRSDFEIATQPKTRGAFWLKTAQAELVPKLLMLMATAGLFGEALKEMFAKIGDYDKTNYTVIPMGIDENGKTTYFRIPSDETGRLIGGLFWKLARTVQDPTKLADADTYGDLLAYAGGQVPSITPVATSAFNIREFLAGNNPYDFFRGRPVLTTEQMQAGGTEKLKPFLSYMFQQLGGGVFAKLYTNETVPQNPSLSEKIVSLPVVSNIAGRFIKSSDYGEVERIREVSGEVRSEKAKENITNRKTVFEYVTKAQNKPYGEVQAIKREMVKEIYNGVPQTPEDRTQARNLEKRFDTLLLRGKSDAKIDALITAPSNDEKVALLVEYSLTMKDSEFAELKQFIIKNRVVSSDVFQRFNRVDK